MALSVHQLDLDVNILCRLPSLQELSPQIQAFKETAPILYFRKASANDLRKLWSDDKVTW